MENKKANNRIMIFIDGSNLYHIVKNLLPDKKPNDFNFEKFTKYLAGNRDLIRTYYYNVPLDIMQDLDSYMKQQKFFDKIQRIPNFKFVLCRMQKRAGFVEVLRESCLIESSPSFSSNFFTSSIISVIGFLIYAH